MALAATLLPFALAIIMLGLGLSLTLADFKRVLAYPKATLVALGCQIVVLPALCFGLVILFGLPPVLAVGMMLLAASPGGTTANLYSHLFGGDVALNITLTAINSVLAIITLPLVTNLSIGYFASDGTLLSLEFAEFAKVVALVLIPVAIGMLVRAYATAFADRMAKPVKITSAVVLLLVIAAVLIKERENLGDYIASVGLICLIFSAVSLAIGYYAPRLAKVERGQAIASCFEIGLHNATLSITVATTLLANDQMSIPSATYGVLMFFTATAAGFLLRSRSARLERSAA
ncbi:bile acid:sodium symporter family protein [Nonomuraea soli]|uniref:BASS family bile acid:Na+ symporter n=1 Tax=Nonomuraea soli TaxID=1032476 RepID=A0A7W0CJX6_9ACTN|nr:bile acid:sodium symporter family protein [Nonomuraea soli]MBA2892439.1 BASS family bile acid:Na+ symporter [Nonomuraea soli]